MKNMNKHTKADIEKVRKFFNIESLYKQLKTMVSFVIPNKRNVKLILNIGGGSYTDGKSITLGLPEAFILKSREEQLSALLALCGHEAQHINSSDFKGFVKFQEDLGNYYMKKFKLSHKGYGMKLGKHLLNSVEDGRIEKILCINYPGFLKHIKFLNMTFWETAEVKGNSELEDFLWTITYLSVTGLYPKGYKNLYKGTESHENILKIKPLIEEGVNAVSAQQCIQSCWDIVYATEDYIGKLLQNRSEEDEQFIKSIPEDAEWTTSEEKEYGDSSSESSPTHFKPKKKKEDEKSEEEKGEKKEKEEKKKDKSKSAKKDDEETSDEEESKGESGEGTESDEKESEKSGEKEESEGSGGSSENEEELDESEDDNSSGSGGSDKEEEDTEGDEESKASGGSGEEEDDKSEEEGAKDSEGSDKGDEKSDSDSDSEGNDTDSSSKDGSKKDDETTNDTPENSGNSSEDDDLEIDEEEIRAEIKGISDEMAEEMEEKIKDIENEERKNANRQSESESSLLTQEDIAQIEQKYKHDSYNRFKEIKDYIKPFSLPNEIKVEGRKIRREIEKLFKNKETYSQRSQRKGSLDASSLYKVGIQDYNVFVKKGAPVTTDYVAFILQDGSGSMSNNNKEVFSGKAMALIEEGFKTLIPMKISTFSTTRHNTVHYTAKDWKDNQINQNYAYNSHRSRQATGGNKDGFSIRVATKELLKRPEKDRILIILSDGLPTDYNGGEKEGLNDVKQAVKEARQAGIHLVSIIFGTQSFRDANINKYKFMYDKNIISCNPNEIGTRLTKTLKGILAR